VHYTKTVLLKITNTTTVMALSIYKSNYSQTRLQTWYFGRVFTHRENWSKIL